VIINEHDVIVVDANITTSSSRLVIDEIKRLTPNPVRYVIATHAHSDHIYGNQAYREAWPGVDFIAHHTVRDDVINDDIPSFEKNLNTEYPAIIARVKTALATGRRSNGAVVTPQDHADLTRQLQLYEWFVREAGTFRPLPPTITVTDSLVIHRGDRTVVIRHLGRANTHGDLIIHLPGERIVATGDIVVSPTPFSFGSYLGDWVATLAALKRYDAAVILPGHGEPMRDWSYVDRLSTLFAGTLAQVRAAAAGGASLDSVRKVVTLDAFRAQWAGTDRYKLRAFDNLFRTPAVERAYLEARGEIR
jgi:glyoxylase-like metal-dependent hydrolase (beta-lactamase superfamily II)